MTDTTFDAPLTSEDLDLSNAPGVQSKIAGDHPVMEVTDDSPIELPRGLYLSGGWHKSVKVRELNGYDEEILARYKTFPEQVDGIIALGVTDIGGVSFTKEPSISARVAMIDQLLVPERLYLYLRVVGATFGNEKKLKIVCSNCKAEQETTILIDHDFPLEVGEDGLSDSYSYTTRKGEEIQFNLITSGDVKAASDNKLNTNTAQVNSDILARVIHSVDGRTPIDMHEFVRALSIKDRVELLEEIQKSQPSIDLEIDVDCIGCGEGQHIPLQWEDMFRP